MKSLIVYDSVYGNTKTIAETVAKELGSEARVVPVSDFKTGDLKGVNLLVVGSPILGWQPSEKTRTFLAGLKPGQLKGIKAAAFDTRMTIFIHGDAAGKIAAQLAGAGAAVIADAVGFYVTGRQGPLKKGELERAAAWARTVKNQVQ